MSGIPEANPTSKNKPGKSPNEKSKTSKSKKPKSNKVTNTEKKTPNDNKKMGNPSKTDTLKKGNQVKPMESKSTAPTNRTEKSTMKQNNKKTADAGPPKLEPSLKQSKKTADGGTLKEAVPSKLTSKKEPAADPANPTFESSSKEPETDELTQGDTLYGMNDIQMGGVLEPGYGPAKPGDATEEAEQIKNAESSGASSGAESVDDAKRV